MKQILKIAREYSHEELLKTIGATPEMDENTVKKLKKKWIVKNHPDRGGSVDSGLFGAVGGMGRKKVEPMGQAPQVSSQPKPEPPKKVPTAPPVKQNNIFSKKNMSTGYAAGGAIGGAAMGAANIKDLSNKDTRSKGIKGLAGQAAGAAIGAGLSHKFSKGPFKKRNMIGSSGVGSVIGGAIGRSL